MGRATAALPSRANQETTFASDGLDFDPDAFTAPQELTATPAAPIADSQMLEFDMSSLSLDLSPTTESPSDIPSKEHDPLEVKFLLAEEFRSLGDSDGARSLAEEVMANASGPLKVKAQAFLNTLS